MAPSWHQLAFQGRIQLIHQSGHQEEGHEHREAIAPRAPVYVLGDGQEQCGQHHECRLLGEQCGRKAGAAGGKRPETALGGSGEDERREHPRERRIVE